jgi:small subunit ribosomal protein S6
MYEHVFLARQDVTAQQVTGLMNTFKAVIEENGGSVGKTEYWGVKSLAFKIKKNRKAHYTFLNIDAPHAAVAEMERQMRISPDIIRFLTVRVDELDEKPTVMMRRQDDRDRERGDRGDRGDRGGRPPRREGGFGGREGGFGGREGGFGGGREGGGFGGRDGGSRFGGRDRDDRSDD